MIKNYGDHGEIFCAILFDKFIFPKIKKEGYIFEFFGYKLKLKDWYEHKTKAGGTQLADLWFILTFYDEKFQETKPFTFNIFIEAKTFLRGNSNNSLKESASKLDDEIAENYNLGLYDLGSTYFIFRMFENNIDQNTEKRLNNLIKQSSSFPDSYFQIYNKLIGLGEKNLEKLLNELEGIDGIMLNSSIKSWGTICDDGKIKEEVVNKLGEKIDVTKLLEYFKEYLYKHIDIFSKSIKRYDQVANLLIEKEPEVEYKNNTEEGFSYISGDDKTFQENLNRAKASHERYGIRKIVLSGKPLLSNDIEKLEKEVYNSKKDIYEDLEHKLYDNKQLHPSVAEIMNNFISSINGYKIKNYILNDTNQNKGLFFYRGANKQHCLRYENDRFYIDYDEENDQ